MIERELLNQNKKEFIIKEFVAETLSKVGLSDIKLQKTPLGEKIVINASRPGLVVGRKGQNIKKLSDDVKKKFKLENPQIEIEEVEAPNLDPVIIAERIANSLERFGLTRFKGVGHKAMEDVMLAGALGVEIIISGKVPSSRAKSWRFYAGYLKKSGDASISGVRKAVKVAKLKTGIIGIKVSIMPPDIKLPDRIKLVEEENNEEPAGEEKQAPTEDLKENEPAAGAGEDEDAHKAVKEEGKKEEKKKKRATKKKKEEDKKSDDSKKDVKEDK